MLCPPLLPCLGSSRQGEEDDDNDDGGNDGDEESDKNGVSESKMARNMHLTEIKYDSACVS